LLLLPAEQPAPPRAYSDERARRLDPFPEKGVIRCTTAEGTAL
jgi:hypothetical protein